jgi:hypothetical protein
MVSVRLLQRRQRLVEAAALRQQPGQHEDGLPHVRPLGGALVGAGGVGEPSAVREPRPRGRSIVRCRCVGGGLGGAQVAGGDGVVRGPKRDRRGHGPPRRPNVGRHRRRHDQCSRSQSGPRAPAPFGIVKRLEPARGSGHRDRGEGGPVPCLDVEDDDDEEEVVEAPQQDQLARRPARGHEERQQRRNRRQEQPVSEHDPGGALPRGAAGTRRPAAGARRSGAGSSGGSPRPWWRTRRDDGPDRAPRIAGPPRAVPRSSPAP